MRPRTKNIAIPYWEAVGPWDVDNDNDGVPDSIWVDLGDPIQQAEDGTRYKPLYAFLIIDLDSRLNVNAHGMADDISPPALALSYDLNGQPMTLGNCAQSGRRHVQLEHPAKGRGLRPGRNQPAAGVPSAAQFGAAAGLHREPPGSNGPDR